MSERDLTPSEQLALHRALHKSAKRLSDPTAAARIRELEADLDAARAGYNRALLDTSSLAADLARVTQEREQSRTNEAHAWNMQVATEAERDALAAKLARAKGLLQRALAAFKAKGVVRGVDEWCDECAAYFATSEQEPRT